MFSLAPDAPPRIPVLGSGQFRGNKKPLLIGSRRGDDWRALLIFPKSQNDGSWAGIGTWSLKSRFNRLPWRHGASPSTTLN